MATPFKKIRGKQITNNEITAVHLLNTGSTAAPGQIPSYDAGSGGFTWISLSADTIQSVSGGTALTTINPTGTNVILNVNTDNQTIYVNGSNQLHLGDPSNNNLITGPQFGFSNNVIIYGNLTVNGTATTVNSETVTIADNFILLNSNFTAGTPTQNAGIEISRGSEPNAFIRWNEVNDYWEISNPSTGTTSAATYSAILTTASIESGPQGSPNNKVTVTQGTGINSDILYLDIDEANLTNIPNSALTNSNITVNAGFGLGGGGTVALGGSITLSATCECPDYFVTGGTTSYGVSNVGTLTLNRQNGSVNISIEDTYVTGGTLVGSNIILGRNDGQTVTVDLSALDVNDTYSTGGTVTTNANNNSNSQVFQITGNGGFVPYNVTGLTDTYVTGGTLSGNNIVLTRNDGNQVNIDISGADFNDTYVTGGTSTGASNFSPNATISLLYNQDVAPGTYSLNYEDTFLTGASVTNGTLSLTRNDSVTVTATGTILQSLTAQNGLTATTSNGAVTIGIQPAGVTNSMLQNSSITVVDDDVVTASTSVSLGGTLNVGLAQNTIKEVHLYVTGGTPTPGQYLTYDGGSGGFIWVTQVAAANPVTLNKGMVPSATTGNDASTGLYIATTPSSSSYVGVSVNGVWYEVGNGVTSKDCYFDLPTGCGSGSPRTFATLAGGDSFCWNGTNAGFDLDTFDRVDFYFDA